MSTPEASRYVRLRVDLVLDVQDSDALTKDALRRIVEDGTLRPDERAHAESVVQSESAEAIAYVVDPFDLVNDVPGVELVQASWSSEEIDYDPDSPDGDLDEDDDGDYDGDGGLERGDDR
ncbi:hypothetical protein ACFVT5_02535 [Streptomyces sp. NPDC058001]|uniref:hypothetical protein n=1 Tax=Streptomyces sp. NPDC058001 TaxID=3346300 RepID=UPI0036E8F652